MDKAVNLLSIQGYQSSVGEIQLSRCYLTKKRAEGSRPSFISKVSNGLFSRLKPREL